MEGHSIEAPWLLIKDCIPADLTHPCEIWGCRYNLFFKEDWTRCDKNSDIAKEIKNCVLLIESPLTLEEIGKMWGLSRERIRQIENCAIIKFIKRFALLHADWFTPEEHDLIRSLSPNQRKLKLHPTGG